jgi:hypothetical protein
MIVKILSIVLHFSKSIARSMHSTGVITMYGIYASEHVCNLLYRKFVKQIKIMKATNAELNPIFFNLFVSSILHPSFAQWPNIAPMKNIGILAYVSIINPP